MSGNLERRYRRVLRLLPGWYRRQWEEDMVAAFLDSWLTGDSEADEYINKAAAPGLAETASVAGLAVRLHLGGAGIARRYFWGQAVRRATLAVALVQAMRGLEGLVAVVWSRRMFAWVPAPPESMASSGPAGMWQAIFFVVGYAWIVVFVLMVLRYYRAAQALAALAIVPYLVWLLYGQLTDRFAAPPVGPWAFWVLINLGPVLAMTAFHRDVRPAVRWPLLLALPAGYLVVYAPLLALVVTGNSAWIPDFSGLYCTLVALACLAHAPRAWSRRVAGSGEWSLALVVLAADAAAYRIFSITDYRHDPHLIAVSVVELLILLAAVATVVPDAVRARAGTPTPARSGAAAGMTSRWPWRTQDMPFQPSPRSSSILAGALGAAGIVLTIAGCSHIAPLGPQPQPPPVLRTAASGPAAGPAGTEILQPGAVAQAGMRRLGSPILLQVMRSQPATGTGGCAAGWFALSVPGSGGTCYRKLGTPLSITSAVVSPVSASPPGQPARYGFSVVVPAADVAALTAVSTDAYNARGVLAVIVAGKTWLAPQVAGPFLGGQFKVAFPSRNQALDLYRILVPHS
jgi:hypothetical protein